LNSKLHADLSPDDARKRLESYCRQWHGKVVCADTGLLVCHLNLPRGFWRKYVGRPMGVELVVTLEPPAAPGSRQEIDIEARALGSEGTKGEQLLAEVAPVLVRSLRDCLQTQSEHRARERLACIQPLIVYPVLGNFELGPAVECLARDVSLSGVGFVSPQRLDTAQIYLNPAPSAQGSLAAILARIVRLRPRDDGQFDVGAFFQFDESEMVRA
jgi:hypothetical protein